MIPIWLDQHLKKTCACGYPIGNNTNLTVRRCLNPCCPYHMAQRVADLAKIMGVKGVGPAKALELVKNNGFKSHLEAIPIWFDEKPEKYLHEIASLCMIDGMDKELKKYCDGYASFTHMFMNEDKLPMSIRVHKTIFLDAEQYFKIKPPLSKHVINIMITGEIYGMPSRTAFVNGLNDTYGQYFQIVDVGVRKTNVMCLIREKDTPYHNKTRIAEERNIPIVTPVEFIGILDDVVNGKGGVIENADS